MDLLTRVTGLLIVLMQILVISCEIAGPKGMKQGIYCECCSATVKEISKKLEKKSSDPWDVKVLEAMEEVCKASSFNAYTYSPPTTVKACKHLLENYEEEIEQIFTTKKSDQEKKICYELTKACEGVDRSKKEKEDINVNVNGQQQNADDGVNRLNVDINDPNSASRLAEQIKQQMAMQQDGGASDYDDDDDEEEPEEGEKDEAENLLDNYDEDGNEKPQSDSSDKPKGDDNDEKPKDDDNDEKPKDDDKKEEKTSTKEKTEL